MNTRILPLATKLLACCTCALAAGTERADDTLGLSESLFSLAPPAGGASPVNAPNPWRFSVGMGVEGRSRPARDGDRTGPRILFSYW